MHDGGTEVQQQAKRPWLKKWGVDAKMKRVDGAVVGLENSDEWFKAFEPTRTGKIF